jgi:large subunit ribosomal protein L4
MECAVYNLDDLENSTKSKINLGEDFLNDEYNEDLIWQVVNSIRYQRITKKDTKNRSEANGGGKKPWRQKGTGRARAGTSRSPIWVGGGITFNHKSRVCSHKINKKMYKKAVSVILSEYLRSDKLVIIEDLASDSPKTSSLKSKITKWTDINRVLLLTNEIDTNFHLATRNFYEFNYGEWQYSLCPDKLSQSNLVVITKKAIEEVKEWLA